MTPTGNVGTYADKTRKIQQFKRRSGKNGRKVGNTYSNQAVEQAENLRNRGVTG